MSASKPRDIRKRQNPPYCGANFSGSLSKPALFSADDYHARSATAFGEATLVERVEHMLDRIIHAHPKHLIHRFHRFTQTIHWLHQLLVDSFHQLSLSTLRVNRDIVPAAVSRVPRQRGHATTRDSRPTINSSMSLHRRTIRGHLHHRSGHLLASTVFLHQMVPM